MYIGVPSVTPFLGQVHRLGPLLSAEAEVGDLDHPLGGHQQILGLDVPMDQAQLGGGLHRPAGLPHHRDRLDQPQGPFADQQVPEIHPVDIFHRQVSQVVVPTHRENLDDVGMIQARDHRRLDLESA